MSIEYSKTRQLTPGTPKNRKIPAFNRHLTATPGAFRFLPGLPSRIGVFVLFVAFYTTTGRMPGYFIPVPPLKPLVSEGLKQRTKFNKNFFTSLDTAKRQEKKCKRPPTPHRRGRQKIFAAARLYCRIGGRFPIFRIAVNISARSASLRALSCASNSARVHCRGPFIQRVGAAQGPI